jgi:hypothetical protein
MVQHLIMAPLLLDLRQVSLLKGTLRRSECRVGNYGILG